MLPEELAKQLVAVLISHCDGKNHDEIAVVNKEIVASFKAVIVDFFKTYPQHDQGSFGVPDTPRRVAKETRILSEALLLCHPGINGDVDKEIVASLFKVLQQILKSWSHRDKCYVPYVYNRLEGDTVLQNSESEGNLLYLTKEYPAIYAWIMNPDISCSPLDAPFKFCKLRPRDLNSLAHTVFEVALLESLVRDLLGVSLAAYLTQVSDAAIDFKDPLLSLCQHLILTYAQPIAEHKDIAPLAEQSLSDYYQTLLHIASLYWICYEHPVKAKILESVLSRWIDRADNAHIKAMIQAMRDSELKSNKRPAETGCYTDLYYDPQARNHVLISQQGSWVEVFVRPIVLKKDQTPLIELMRHRENLVTLFYNNEADSGYLPRYYHRIPQILFHLNVKCKLQDQDSFLLSGQTLYEFLRNRLDYLNNTINRLRQAYGFPIEAAESQSYLLPIENNPTTLLFRTTGTGINIPLSRYPSIVFASQNELLLKPIETHGLSQLPQDFQFDPRYVVFGPAALPLEPSIAESVVAPSKASQVDYRNLVSWLEAGVNATSSASRDQQNYFSQSFHVPAELFEETPIGVDEVPASELIIKIGLGYSISYYNEEFLALMTAHPMLNAWVKRVGQAAFRAILDFIGFVLYGRSVYVKKTNFIYTEDLKTWLFRIAFLDALLQSVSFGAQSIEDFIKSIDFSTVAQQTECSRDPIKWLIQHFIKTEEIKLFDTEETLLKILDIIEQHHNRWLLKSLLKLSSRYMDVHHNPMFILLKAMLVSLDSLAVLSVAEVRAALSPYKPDVFWGFFSSAEFKNLCDLCSRHEKEPANTPITEVEVIQSIRQSGNGYRLKFFETGDRTLIPIDPTGKPASTDEVLISLYNNFYPRP